MQKNGRNYYSKNFTIDKLYDKIKKAITDITAYDKELDLYNNMREYVDVADDTKGKNASDIKNGIKYFSPKLFIDMTTVDSTELYFTSICVSDSKTKSHTPIAVSVDNSKYYINGYNFLWDSDLFVLLKKFCSKFTIGMPAKKEQEL